MGVPLRYCGLILQRQSSWAFPLLEGYQFCLLCSTVRVIVNEPITSSTMNDELRIHLSVLNIWWGDSTWATGRACYGHRDVKWVPCWYRLSCGPQGYTGWATGLHRVNHYTCLPHPKAEISAAEAMAQAPLPLGSGDTILEDLAVMHRHLAHPANMCKASPAQLWLFPIGHSCVLGSMTSMFDTSLVVVIQLHMLVFDIVRAIDHFDSLFCAFVYWHWSNIVGRVYISLACSNVYCTLVYICLLGFDVLCGIYVYAYLPLGESHESCFRFCWRPHQFCEKNKK